MIHSIREKPLLMRAIGAVDDPEYRVRIVLPAHNQG